MSEVDLWLLAGLGLAFLFARRQPRAIPWLAGLALSYAVSTVYWRSGLPYAAFIGGICDAIVALAIYFGGKEKWETGLRWLLLVSVSVNLYYLASQYGVVTPIAHNAYATALELINWLALVLIGGSGLLQPAEGANAPAATRGTAGRLSRVARFVHGPRTHPSFLEAR